MIKDLDSIAKLEVGGGLSLVLMYAFYSVEHTTENVDPIWQVTSIDIAQCSILSTESQ